MKKVLYLAVLVFLLAQPAAAQQLVTTDVDHFWNAYDQIRATKDSAQQYALLNKLFIDPGTPGLKAMMQARSYTAKSYIDAINRYPLFWNSIRANTLQANRFGKSIALNVKQLKKLYPDLRPAQIYFTIGAFRSGGTTQGQMILIGSEMALADQNTVTSEFPAGYWNVQSGSPEELSDKIVFTNIHEYVHTQQKTTQTNNLLAQCVLEGVAEFVAVKATDQPSVVPAMAYGRAHMAQVRQRFEKQLFNRGSGFWLYSDAANEFGMRDLGYYIGYAICEAYYTKEPDKKRAIKHMIELDYANENDLAAFVDASGYLDTPVQTLKQQYEAARPTVVRVQSFNPATRQITIEFSAPMNKSYRSFELGPLGRDHLLKIKRVVGFSEDGRSLTLEADLLPSTRYQLVIGEGFRDTDGARLKPYLIDFQTATN